MAAELSTTTAVGTLLNGTYLLERVIAEGGMGVVYEAQHLRLPRRFAVKVLGKPKDDALASTALPRFRREAEIASTLQHPHIVETFDFQVSENGSPYLVMELLEGEDLNERLKRTGRMPIPAALRVIDEIARALDCAHEKGVVHRDLKPANIYLSKRAGRDDFVKVLDFGVSKLIDAATLTQEKAMVGTPLYMSPEQAVGTQELTPESDIFSLGAIAYEILTGRRAFAASSIPSILYQIVHGPTPSVAQRVPGIPPEVDEVFKRVLAKHKEERFRLASQFANTLGQALSREVPRDEEPIPDAGWEPGAQVMERAPAMPTPMPSPTFTGAAATEVDPSTRAEEAMAQAAPTGAGDPLLARAFDAPASETGYVIPGRSRGGWLLFGGVALLAGAGALVVSLARGGPAPAPSASPMAAAASASRSAQASAARPMPAPRPAAIATKPQPLTFAPEPIAAPPHPETVQFSFHVWPKRAEVTVDGKRVKETVTLRWRKEPRRIRIEAPGYRGFIVDAPSIDDRTFEVRLDRVPPKPPPVKKPESRPKPVHQAAPVQDL